MTTELYASADRVFWIVDNGSSHPWTHLGQADDEGLAYRPAGAPAGPCVLVGPSGDLLLHPAAQGADPQRPDRSRRPRRTGTRLPGPLQRHRYTLRLEV